MHWPNSLSPETFLRKFWQTQSLFLPGGIDAALPSLDPDELAWLATLPDVEARLVFTDRQDGKIRYRVEHGPFAESELTALPTEDWTLLVQDVEKHLPDFRALFDQVPFIPAWRFDDLMVSIAAPGGSVGPHKDNYDVFLCQGTGKRNWLLSDDRTVPADILNASLDLLEPFKPTDERLCEPGDVLYVPPGIPHWGIATDFCTTYSIGMRAPSRAEIIAAYARIYGHDSDVPRELERDDSSVFYTDADLGMAEASNGQISLDAVRRMHEQNMLDESLGDEVLMTVLGSVVTDPKPWLEPDAATNDEVEEVLQGQRAMRAHGMALITWCSTAAFSIIFVNGSPRKIPDAGIDLVRELCTGRTVAAETVRLLAAHAEGPEFIAWMLARGILDRD